MDCTVMQACVPYCAETLPERDRQGEIHHVHHGSNDRADEFVLTSVEEVC